MSNSDAPSHPPIYDSLVQEHGDVLNETRRVAEQIRHEVDEVLNGQSRRGEGPQEG
ncbi:hypothetical protein ACFV3R_08980 [Streptomyces sp. NPDC059740]|uniref:hypothetical protein n=1 Tax=Streptomyces sp. NPDC059740 TaxID=3346926 RepID=UPI00364A9563